MTALRNPWLSLSMDAMRLSMETQSVIGLRMVKAAFGGPDAGEEAALMISEKIQAAFDANLVVARSVLAGDGHLAPARAVALYRRRVKANQRRLMKGGRASTRTSS